MQGDDAELEAIRQKRVQQLMSHYGGVRAIMMLTPPSCMPMLMRW